eukprot:1018463-Amphidinium_carterae.2
MILSQQQDFGNFCYLAIGATMRHGGSGCSGSCLGIGLRLTPAMNFLLVSDFGLQPSADMTADAGSARHLSA